ncbi:MAG: ATP-binding cassette domain-containing protein [Beijerinckiaceae bacterium]
MLTLENVGKTYRSGGSLWREGRSVHALQNVSFSIARGESFGLVGESGSGKTTLTRCILRLEEPSGGRILFDGQDMASLSPAALRLLRSKVQIVFQDPYASLNPRMSVHDIVTEPMLVHRQVLGLDSRQRSERAAELLALVGLGPQHLHRFPHEFSGGQRQRIGIARALSTNPALILLDEPTSALDVSVQAQVLNLLHTLQQTLQLTYLFISHDLWVIRYMCDRLAVIHRGGIVETGDTHAVFDAPQSDYTRTLIAAMPEFAPPAPAL